MAAKNIGHESRPGLKTSEGLRSGPGAYNVLLHTSSEADKRNAQGSERPETKPKASTTCPPFSRWGKLVIPHEHTSKTEGGRSCGSREPPRESMTIMKITECIRRCEDRASPVGARATRTPTSASDILFGRCLHSSSSSCPAPLPALRFPPLNLQSVRTNGVTNAR